MKLPTVYLASNATSKYFVIINNNTIDKTALNNCGKFLLWALANWNTRW
jgi:hypothetical protein